MATKKAITAGSATNPVDKAAMLTDSRTADALDLHDALAEKSHKLAALMSMTYGNAAAAFRSLNDELQENYLWACADLAGECASLASRLSLGEGGPA